MIPKKIYYVWFGNNELPSIVQSNLQNWKEKNPEFQIIRIDESNFDIHKYKYVEEAYKQKNWAFASDVARLDVVYNNGGFYFDTDVRFLKSINTLCKFDSVWGMENSGWINSGLIVGAKKGDKDLKNLLNIYNHLTYSEENRDELITTHIISTYFYKLGLKIKNKTQCLKAGQIVFAPDYFAPYHWWGGGKITKNTIAIQQYLNSWGGDTKINYSQKMKHNLQFYWPTMYSFLKKAKNTYKKH